MANTIDTFAIYVLKLVLEWKKAQGGLSALEKRNDEKAQLLYDCLDASDFYRAVAHPEHRSKMNVTFHFPNDELLAKFVKEAQANALYALKGHRKGGGARASIYNAMPREGVQALVDFMKEFERVNG